MIIYTKLERSKTDYSKIKRTTGRGWFDLGWFYDWFREIHIFHRVEKEGTIYNDIEKDVSTTIWEKRG